MSKPTATAPAAEQREGKLKELDFLPLQRRRFDVVIVKRPKRAKATGQGGGEEDDEGEGDGEVYDATLSSEFTVKRWYGNEKLDHSPSAVNLSDRAKDGINLLFNHDPNQPIGRISNLKAAGGKLHGEMRFSKTQAGRDKKQLVDEGMREVSLGYEAEEYTYKEGKDNAPDEITWTRWTPMEGSICSVPADYTVGVGRSAESGPVFPVHVRNISRTAGNQETQMTPEQQAAADAEAARTAEAARAEAARTADANRIAAGGNNANAVNVPAEISRLCTLHKAEKRLTEFLEKNFTLDQVRAALLEMRATDPGNASRTSSTDGLGTGVDLSVREQGAYSYTRAIMAAVEQTEGKRNIKCLELEVSDELQRTMPAQYKQRGGMFIPMSLRGKQGVQLHSGADAGKGGLTLQQRELVMQALTRTGTIDSQTLNAVKEVVFTEYGGELINILRNLALVVKMGARVLTGLSSPIAFPRQTQDVTAYWVPENPGVDVADSNVKTDLVTLTPRTLQAATRYSRQLLVQSSVDVEAMVRESIAAAHALAYDLAALHGTGTNNQPLGIYNQPLVSTVDFTAAVFGVTGNKLAWVGVVEMQRIVASLNALLGNLGFLTTPSIAADGKTSLKFPGAAIAQGGPIWEGGLLEGNMDGVKSAATNQVSKTMGANGAPTGGTNHGLVFGNWTDLLIGQFGGAMEMIVDPYTLKKQGLIEVASFQMADVAVRHPQSFSVAINLAA
jgi:HK97 family phage major capsid protein